MTFADIISNPVGKHSVCVKWNLKAERRAQQQQQQQQVSVRQQSTLNSQPVTVHSASIPHSPVHCTGPYISQSWLKEWNRRRHRRV